MRLDELDYHLPREQIAQRPLDRREASRLLQLDRHSGAIEDRQFTTSFGNESTSAILEVIGTGLHLDVTQTGPRTYTLRAK